MRFRLLLHLLHEETPCIQSPEWIRFWDSLTGLQLLVAPGRFPGHLLFAIRPVVGERAEQIANRMIGAGRVLDKAVQDLLNLITGFVDQLEFLLNGPMLLHGQSGFVHSTRASSAQPIVTRMSRSVDPHLYPFVCQ